MGTGPKNYKIAVTGKAGTGKSTASRIIAGYGFKLIEADKIAHKLLEQNPIKAKIISAFQDDLIDPCQIDRKALANLIFYQPEKRELLNSIMHPPMKKIISEEIKKYPRLILEAAVLPLWSLESQFDLIIRMVSSDKLRKKRLLSKGWSSDIINQMNKIQDEIFDNYSALTLDNSYSDQNKLRKKIEALLIERNLI